MEHEPRHAVRQPDAAMNAPAGGGVCDELRSEANRKSLPPWDGGMASMSPGVSFAGLITRLQSKGIRVPDAITGRRGGAGPAEGRAFVIGGVPVMVPIAAAFVSDSPFSLEPAGDDYVLLEDGRGICNIRVVPDPDFYHLSTPEGLPFNKILCNFS